MDFEAFVLGPRVCSIVRINVYKQVGIALLRGYHNRSVSIWQFGHSANLRVEHSLLQRMKTDRLRMRIALKLFDQLGDSLLHLARQPVKVLQYVPVHH